MAKPPADIASFDADEFMSGGFMAGLDEQGSGDDDAVADGQTAAAGSEDRNSDSGSGSDGGSDDGVGSDDSDDEEANANAMNLKGLAETDPEFFNFLKVWVVDGCEVVCIASCLCGCVLFLDDKTPVWSKSINSSFHYRYALYCDITINP